MTNDIKYYKETSTSLGKPTAYATDKKGNTYIGYNKGTLLKIDTEGTTILALHLSHPALHLVVDETEEIYVSDSYGYIYKISIDGKQRWKKQLKAQAKALIVPTDTPDIYLYDECNVFYQVNKTKLSNPIKMWKLHFTALSAFLNEAKDTIIILGENGLKATFNIECDHSKSQQEKTIGSLISTDLGQTLNLSIEDKVNHPKHYTAYGMESIDIIKNSMSAIEFQGYLKGNTLKYILRFRLKNGVEDLKKSQVYLEWLVKEYSNSETKEKK